MMELKQKEGYDFHGTQITVLTDQNDNPWWVAKEVCDVLGLTHPSKAIGALNLDEKAEVALSPSDLKGSFNKEIKYLRPKKYRIVNEPGLYKLIMKSRKPEAEAFQRWVTHEVLPGTDAPQWRPPVEGRV